jgi:hypothetical protein
VPLTPGVPHEIVGVSGREPLAGGLPGYLGKVQPASGMRPMSSFHRVRWAPSPMYATTAFTMVCWWPSVWQKAS